MTWLLHDELTAAFVTCTRSGPRDQSGTGFSVLQTKPNQMEGAWRPSVVSGKGRLQTSGPGWLKLGVVVFCGTRGLPNPPLGRGSTSARKLIVKQLGDDGGGTPCEQTQGLEATRKQTGVRNPFFKGLHDSGTKERWRCHWCMKPGIGLPGSTSSGNSHK